MSSLSRLVQRLNEGNHGVKFDARNLAQLIAGLLQFMEDALGVNAFNKTLRKLPASLFRDFSPDGPILTIATLCAEFMKAKGLKRIDWQSPATRKDNLDLYARLNQELIRAGHVRQYKILIHPKCGLDKVKMFEQKVKDLGGDVADNDKTPGITHVVHPYGDKGDPDDGQQYLRTLEVKNNEALVHWWYLPDSYDEWMPVEVAPAEIEPEKRVRGPWHVYERWLTDSEKFNEWMNAMDYETEEAVEAEKKQGAAERAAKRAKTEKTGGPGQEVAAGEGQTVAPGVTRRHLLQPNRKAIDHAMHGATIDISQGQRVLGSGVPQVPMPADIDSTKPYEVPASAAWFDMQGIAQLEAESFPNTSMAVYKTVRDFIVNKYKENPGRRLTLCEVLKYVDADADFCRKVHHFLDKHGIINYDAAPSALQGAQVLPAKLKEGTGNFPAGPSSLLKLRTPVTAQEGLEAAVTSATVGRVAPIIVRPGAFAIQPGGSQPAIATGVQYWCSAMPWVDCTAVRYHCTKFPDTTLCPEAYAQGRFPAGASAADFVRIEAKDSIPDPSGWSEQETALLLEAVELFKDDWAAIAEHVGTKNQMQCVMHLLQLPIEDVFLEDIINLSGARKDKSEENLPMPFADSGNPIMAQVAFLASMVGPKVAAAASQAALEALAAEDDDEGPIGIDEARLKAASAVALSAAAVKARVLADGEEREMQRLATSIIEVQHQKMKLKMQQIDKLEELIVAERAQLAGVRKIYFQQIMEKKKEQKRVSEEGNAGVEMKE